MVKKPIGGTDVAPQHTSVLVGQKKGAPFDAPFFNQDAEPLRARNYAWGGDTKVARLGRL